MTLWFLDAKYRVIERERDADVSDLYTACHSAGVLGEEDTEQAQPDTLLGQPPRRRRRAFDKHVMGD